MDQTLRGMFPTLCWILRQKGIQPGTSKVGLIKWLVSVCWYTFKSQMDHGHIVRETEKTLFLVKQASVCCKWIHQFTTCWELRKILHQTSTDYNTEKAEPAIVLSFWQHSQPPEVNIWNIAFYKWTNSSEVKSCLTVFSWCSRWYDRTNKPCCLLYSGKV